VNGSTWRNRRISHRCGRYPLKSIHSIEPAPERAATRHVAAEEPVTARIRRQAQAAADTAALPLQTHQERAARSRLRQARQPALA
jgi:hypothetical protein